MTLFLGPAVHHGYDTLDQPSGDSECIDPSFLDLQYPYEMTRNSDAGYGFTGQPPTLDLSYWTSDLPVDGQSFSPTQYFARPAHDASLSPGRNSQQQSSGISEGTGSPVSQIVYTPSSSHEYDGFPNASSERALDDEDDPSKSPLSDSIFSSTTDSSSFFVVNHADSAEAVQNGRPVSLMNTRPQASASGVSASSSRAPSIAKPPTPNHASSVQWNATASALNGVMSGNTGDTTPGIFGTADEFTFDAAVFNADDHQSLRYDFAADLSAQNNGGTSSFRNATHNSFRSFDGNSQNVFGDAAYTTGSAFDQPAPPSVQLREQGHYFATQHQHAQSLFPQPRVLQSMPASMTYTQATIPATSALMVEHPAVNNTIAAPTTQAGHMPIRSQRIVVHQPQQPPTARPVPYPQTYSHHGDQFSAHQHSHQPRRHRPVIGSNTSTAPSRRVYLAPREDQRLRVVPSNAPAPQSGGSRKGGRVIHSHLPDDVRQRTSKMRGVTACWRCALQRDKVRKCMFHARNEVTLTVLVR